MSNLNHSRNLGRIVARLDAEFWRRTVPARWWSAWAADRWWWQRKREL